MVGLVMQALVQDAGCRWGKLSTSQSQLQPEGLRTEDLANGMLPNKQQVDSYLAET